MAEQQTITHAHIRDLETMVALITQPNARKIAGELLAARRLEYTAYCEGRRANGRKGGRPRKLENHVVSAAKNHVVTVENHVVSAPVSKSLDLKILDLDQRERDRARARISPLVLKAVESFRPK